MKTAKELFQAYINGSAEESAALFADNGALELPYLADLGVEPRYEGRKNIGAFLSFLHEKMYPNFKFVDVKQRVTQILNRLTSSTSKSIPP